jgi:2-C-methyl-D-erythritol 4-phosphate cytidylyltransferase
MKYYAIIVAGGSGLRMKSAIPKQFMLLNDLPVLMHTILKFSNSAHQPAIILVLHPDLHDLWKSMCEKHHFITPHVLVNGGEERFHSVKN